MGSQSKPLTQLPQPLVLFQTFSSRALAEDVPLSVIAASGSPSDGLDNLVIQLPAVTRFNLCRPRLPRPAHSPQTPQICFVGAASGFPGKWFCRLARRSKTMALGARKSGITAARHHLCPSAHSHLAHISVRLQAFGRSFSAGARSNRHLLPGTVSGLLDNT